MPNNFTSNLGHKLILQLGPQIVNTHFHQLYRTIPCALRGCCSRSPCPRGWRYPAEDLAGITRLAVETCVWPLFEVVEGEYHLTYEPNRKLPVADFMRPQGRFRHCFAPGGEWMLEEAQAWVDKKWEKLLAKCR